jgi:hypothetical protein
MKIRTTSSDKKKAANKRNAQKSTGPNTDRGKLTSSRNSLKNGLFSRGLYVAEVDKPMFDAIRARYVGVFRSRPSRLPFRLNCRRHCWFPDSSNTRPSDRQR